MGETDAGELRVPCDVYSRIVGYLRPTQNWNDGKQQEFRDRVPFNVEEVDNVYKKVQKVRRAT